MTHVETLTPQDLVTRHTPVSMVRKIIPLEPVIVRTGQSLLEVAEAMVKHPGINVACVVDEQQHLVGLLALRSLADDLFMQVVPEEFLGEAHDLQTALEFARLNRTETAGDAMTPPAWVTDDDTVKQAFHVMHINRMSGVPVVNDALEVSGYINLLELLALCARTHKSSNNTN